MTIQEENKHEGTTDWLLDKIADPDDPAEEDALFQRRKAVEAFCSHQSIRAGETITVFASADPPGPVKADIYRMGYYGGTGGRLMHSVGPIELTAQPVPDDGPKNLRECHWAPSFEVTIPGDWTSGVYLGKMTQLESGFQAYFIFIVRDDRKADFLFQCSDMTWQAYNRWPKWRSQYDWEGNHWHTSAGADVSFDRPYGLYYNKLPSDFNPLTLGSGEFLLWEFPLAFWLEREGYDITYISNLDTQADPDGLLRAKGLLSVGHDEYWTQTMVDNVARARDLGLNIAFLSGNSVCFRIHLDPSSDGRPMRIFGRECIFPDGGADLMGAATHGVGSGDWTCVQPGHWPFAGTGMQKGDAIPRLVGWEYQGYPLRQNDSSLLILAEGPMVTCESGQPYAATIYDGPKGNFVFNAATCWWSQPLSSPPGFKNPPNNDFTAEDPRVQRMTANLLNRMIGK
jgi:hypothetical protein